MKTDIEQLAKDKGLPEFTTKQLVDLIKIEMLYTSYKSLEDIVIKKPTKPIKPNTPVEPIKPEIKVEPELKIIPGNSPEIEKINIELYQEYKEKTIQYNESKQNYEKDMKNFQIESLKYQNELRDFPDNLENYNKKIKKYELEQAKYERYLFQKKLNKKIEDTYKKWTGKLFNPNIKSDKMTYFMLIGPPGHGKTTVFRQSAKLVASELELVYKENPTVEDPVDINSFVLYVNNLAGEVSKMGAAGLPAKVKDLDGKEYTGTLPSYSMSALTKAGAGVLLLDDLANASSFIQNIALPLTNDNSFNELKLNGVYVGITANMGAIDGTNTSTISSALRNRVKVVFTKDDVNDFILRTRRETKFFDDIGDFFVSDFLEEKKDNTEYMNKLFYTIPDKTEMGGFSNPRSLVSTINELRRIVYDYGDFNEQSKEVIKLTLMSTLGKSVGGDLYEYIEDVHSGIAPLVNDLFLNKKFNQEKFKENVDNIFDPKTKIFEYKFRKFLERKIRNEAFSISLISEENEKTEKKEELYKKIAIIYPILTEQQRGAFSSSLREDVFFGLKDFSTYHPNSSTGEILKAKESETLVEIIKNNSRNYLEDEYIHTLNSIIKSQPIVYEDSPPKKRRKLA